MSSSLIMLVDDDEAFLGTMVKRLSKRQLQVVSARGGIEALQLLQQRDMDVVILDVKMPGISGIETLKRIKQDHPLVEVIMLSGYATVEAAIEGMKLGAFDYLMKPCDMEKLMAIMGDAVEKKRRQEDKIKQAAVRKALATT